MTDHQLEQQPQGQQPSRQQLAAIDRSAPGKVTGRLKVAIEAMVWQSMKRADAAQAAGLKEQSLYVALARPHVRAYYLAQCEVLRTSGRARRIHLLEQIAEQDDNKQAAVNAIRALDYQEDTQQAAARQQQAPGFVIQVITQQMPHQRTIEAKPLTSQGMASHEAAALPNQGDADD